MRRQEGKKTEKSTGPLNAQNKTEKRDSPLNLKNSSLSSVFVSSVSERNSFVLIIITVVSITVLNLWVLNSFSKMIYGSSNAEYILFPNSAYWFIPSLFLALVFSFFIVKKVLVILCNGNYESYEYASRYKYGYDGLAVFKWAALAALFLSMLMIVFGLNWYVELTYKNIIFNDFFSIYEVHKSYADVSSIIRSDYFEAMNGDVLTEENYKVCFMDGYCWSSRDSILEFPVKTIRDVATFISGNSGVKITHSDFYN